VNTSDICYPVLLKQVPTGFASSVLDTFLLQFRYGFVQYILCFPTSSSTTPRLLGERVIAFERHHHHGTVTFLQDSGIFSRPVTCFGEGTRTPCVIAGHAMGVGGHNIDGVCGQSLSPSGVAGHKLVGVCRRSFSANGAAGQRVEGVRG